MFGLNLWDILGIIAIIFLLASFAIGKNAIWGALTIGVIVCLLIGIVRLLNGTEFFNWVIFKKVVIVSIWMGAFFEIISRLLKVSLKSNKQ